MVAARPPQFHEPGDTATSEYQFTTQALEASGNLRRLKIAIGLLCMSMAALGVLSQVNPFGPHGLWSEILHGTAIASALVVGICWIVLPWPSRRVAIAFVFWADVATFIAGITHSQPFSQFAATNHLALIGVFAAFLLGWRILAVHCLFAAAAISGMALWNLDTGAATLAELYVYTAPPYSNVVLLPVVIQAVIEGVRSSMRSTVSAANRDPLTGLLNRRGVRAAMGSLLREQPHPAVLAVVVADVDNFKELNDTLGHDAGDSTLRAFAQLLAERVGPSAITARIGGDEFMVVAFLDSPSKVDDLVDLVCIPCLSGGQAGVTISAGAAWAYTDDVDLDFESLMRQADFRLYEAKRARRA